MIVTEEDAKTKRCQESFGDRIIGNGDVAETEMDSDPLWKGRGSAAMQFTSPVNCIGSACMAWRWWLSAGVNGIDRSRGDDMSKGYCGKASLP